MPTFTRRAMVPSQSDGGDGSRKVRNPRPRVVFVVQQREQPTDGTDHRLELSSPASGLAFPAMTGRATSLPKAPFGTVFAPTMASTTFDESGYGAVRLHDVETFDLHPGAHVFHYASACFEGLKAHRGQEWGGEDFSSRCTCRPNAPER